MLKTFSLKNGVKVATYSLPSVKSIHLRTIVKCGGIVENEHNNGVAHFMEHMLVQGIPTYPNVEAFSSYIESVAGSYSAHTSRFSVNFSITLPASHLADAVTIGSEIVAAPLFVDEAIEKERQAVIAEIMQKMDSHWYSMNEFSRKARFHKGHPMLLAPGGDLAVVKALTRADMIAFWQTYFVPKNTYVVLIGNLGNTDVKRLLTESFGTITAKQIFAGYPQTTRSDFRNRMIIARRETQVKTCYVTVSFPAIGFENSKENADLREKQSLALTILGELRNSRLFKLLRYQKGLVYDCGVGAALLPGLGYVQAYAEVTEENLFEVLTLLAQEIRNFVDHGPTKEELQFAKNYLNNQWQMSFDHPSSIADWVESELLEDDIIRMPEDYAEILAGITQDDLKQLMQTKWDFARLQVLVQGPVHNTAENQAKMRSIFSHLQ